MPGMKPAEWLPWAMLHPWAGDATWSLRSLWDGSAGRRAGTVMMFSVQSLGSIQEMSRTADAGDVTRCNFVLSLVGIINCSSTTGVRSPAGGRAALPCLAVLCSVALMMTAVTTTWLGLLPLRCLSTVCFSLLEADKQQVGPRGSPAFYSLLFHKMRSDFSGLFIIRVLILCATCESLQGL